MYIFSSINILPNSKKTVEILSPRNAFFPTQLKIYSEYWEKLKLIDARIFGEPQFINSKNVNIPLSNFIEFNYIDFETFGACAGQGLELTFENSSDISQKIEICLNGNLTENYFNIGKQIKKIKTLYYSEILNSEKNNIIISSINIRKNLIDKLIPKKLKINALNQFGFLEEIKIDEILNNNKIEMKNVMTDFFNIEREIDFQKLDFSSLKNRLEIKFSNINDEQIVYLAMICEIKE